MQIMLDILIIAGVIAVPVILVLIIEKVLHLEEIIEELRRNEN